MSAARKVFAFLRLVVALWLLAFASRDAREGRDLHAVIDLFLAIVTITQLYDEVSR